MCPSTSGGPYPFPPRSECVTVLYLMSSAVKMTPVTLPFAALRECTENPHLCSLHAPRYVSVATIPQTNNKEKKQLKTIFQVDRHLCFYAHTTH